MRIDGDPREALLFGAREFVQFDAISGVRDGSVRAYVLATKEGLYAAILSTETGGAFGIPTGVQAEANPSGAAAPGIVARAMGSGDPARALWGDWMALRVQGPKSAIFVLTAGGEMTSLGEDSLPSGLSDLSWVVAGSRFGHTWAGEWMIPWSLLGLHPGEEFRVSALRGRKLVAGGSSLEVLNASSPEASSGRWGGEGVPVAVPSAPIVPLSAPRALRPYEVRPCVPAENGIPACEDDVPAGEVATAWLELPPSTEPAQVEITGASGPVESFRVDFWWQAGRREEQDALFRARVSAGGGDVLVAERLFPLGPEGVAPSAWPVRVYLRTRVPRGATPGPLSMEIRVRQGGRLIGTLPWRVRVAPVLPPTRRMAGIYYGERDFGRWAADLADMAAHGLNAVSCPASGAEATGRFVTEAAKAGLDGSFLMDPGAPRGDDSWAYVADEPASQEAVERARTRAADLKARGYRTWAALAWPNSLPLAKDLDQASLAPNLLALDGAGEFAKGHWVYFQGLREDPLRNRVAAGLLSFARGLSGFWVFCYDQGDARDTDWSHPFLRHDACVENGPRGERIQTVEWEALREGIVDARLREALGEKIYAADAAFPAVAAVLRGEDWRADAPLWEAQAYRRALLESWERIRGLSGGRP